MIWVAVASGTDETDSARKAQMRCTPASVGVNVYVRLIIPGPTGTPVVEPSATDAGRPP